MEVGAGHLVQRFYHEVWNKADETVAREILHAGLRFKTLLDRCGPGRKGSSITCARFMPVWRATDASSKT